MRVPFRLRRYATPVALSCFKEVRAWYTPTAQEMVENQTKVIQEDPIASVWLFPNSGKPCKPWRHTSARLPGESRAVVHTTWKSRREFDALRD